MNVFCNLALILCASNAGGAPLYVIDGDGFSLGGQTVRIWGIDAPELSQECANASGTAYPCGSYAKRALSQILADAVPACETITRDQYGRDVARCSVHGQDIGHAMVRAGWAVDYTQFSEGAYLSAQTEAQRRQLGLWSGSFSMPWHWREHSN